MMAWLGWLAAALVLGVIEMLTVDLTFLMLACGALGGAVAAACGAGGAVQVLVLAVVSVLGLVAVRPWAKRHLRRSSPQTLTNAQALVGRAAVALTPIDGDGGQVRLEGAVWSARLAPRAGAGVLEAGTSVRVEAIDGAVAVVVADQS